MELFPNTLNVTLAESSSAVPCNVETRCPEWNVLEKVKWFENSGTLCHVPLITPPVAEKQSKPPAGQNRLRNPVVVANTLVSVSASVRLVAPLTVTLAAGIPPKPKY